MLKFCCACPALSYHPVARLSTAVILVLGTCILWLSHLRNAYCCVQFMVHRDRIRLRCLGFEGIDGLKDGSNMLKEKSPLFLTILFEPRPASKATFVLSAWMGVLWSYCRVLP